MDAAVQFAALAAKYRALAGFRRDKARLGEDTPRARLRELAALFPGALRELDTQPLELLDARATALEAAARDPAAAQPWMEWLVSFHALMRGALLVRRTLRQRRSASAAELAQISEAATALCGQPFPPALVASAGDPPRGRAATSVLAWLAARAHLEPAQLERLLFPPHPGRDPASGPDRSPEK